MNALRGHLAEFGIVAAKGIGKVADLIGVVRDPDDRACHRRRARPFLSWQDKSRRCGSGSTGSTPRWSVALEPTRRRGDWRRSRASAQSPRLRYRPWCPIRRASSRDDISRRGSASPHGRTRAGARNGSGGISRQGNALLRSLLVLGATARLRYAKRAPEATDWSTRLLARRPFKVAAVALANKMARIAWALLVKGGTYTMPAAA